jgi:EpsI family protein
MGLLFWVGSFWAEDTRSPADSTARPVVAASEVRPGTFYAVATLAVIAAALWRPLYAGITPAPIEERVTLAPIASAGAWSPGSEMPTTWTPSYSGFTADARQAFVNQGATAAVYVAYYRAQRKGHELVTTANQLVLPRENRFVEVASGVVEVPIAGERRSVLRADIAGLRDRLVAYRLYWVDGRLTSSDAMAKALLAWSRLTRGTGDAALVVVYARQQDGRDVAREALEALWPSIERSLVATRNVR